MKDQKFIEQLLVRGRDAREKSRTEFGNISYEQLNWKASPESWSIGQCLDHLLVSDMLYFPVLKKIGEGKFHMRFWERRSPFSVFFGKMLVQQTQEKVRSKMNAPSIFKPSESQVDMGIIDRFHKHLDTLLAYIAACSLEDLDKTKITSPVSKLITYSLRDALQILIQHLHRHLNQAMKVKLAIQVK